MRRSSLVFDSVLFLASFIMVFAAVKAQEPSQQQDIDAQILIGAARNAVHLGDDSAALERYENALKLVPDNDEVRMEYAGILFKARQVDKASQEYSTLLKKYPDRPELIRSLVDTLLATGDLSRAGDVLSEALKKFPTRLDFAIDLARIEALDNNFKGAAKIVDEHIKGKEIPRGRLQLDALELFIQIRRPELARPLLEQLEKTSPTPPRFLPQVFATHFLSVTEKPPKQKPTGWIRSIHATSTCVPNWHHRFMRPTPSSHQSGYSKVF